MKIEELFYIIGTLFFFGSVAYFIKLIVDFLKSNTSDILKIEETNTEKQIEQKIELQSISILEYSKMLKNGTKKDIITQIEAELSKLMGNLGSNFDVGLFMLNKDLLIFQCKLALSIFEFDDAKIALYEKKINELKSEIKKRSKDTESSTPYKNFLNWILSVEKYIGFSIDRNNDLLYLVEATNQMLKYYESQKQNIEQQNAKK